MIKHSLKHRQVLLFPVISFLIMILLPVSCLADAQKIFKENNKVNYENTSEYWLSQGNAYFSSGMKRSARDAFNRALEIEPDYMEAYFNRGLAYGGLGDFQQAIKDFNNL